MGPPPLICSCQDRAQETASAGSKGWVGSRKGPEVWQRPRGPAPKTGMRKISKWLLPFFLLSVRICDPEQINLCAPVSPSIKQGQELPVLDMVLGRI